MAKGWYNRERASNFTAEECQRLTQLLESYKDVILSVATGVGSWQKKLKIWRRIEVEFNKNNKGNPFRSEKQLRHKFENMKKAWRKSMESNPYTSDQEPVSSKVKVDYSTDNDNEERSSDPTIEDILGIAETSPVRLPSKSDDEHFRKLKVSQEEELHKQELRHREEEHAIKMAALEAKTLQDEREHSMRMEEYRLKIKVLKGQCSEDVHSGINGDGDTSS